ncbi:hypothetical protein HPY42_04520 [Coprothermobacteraceae bacterium]|nr:hypothetical protein [Coprothermobacteraceae bacterium]
MATTSRRRDENRIIRILTVTAVTLCVLLVLLFMADRLAADQLQELQDTLQSLKSEESRLEDQLWFVNSEYYEEKLKVDVLKEPVDGATVIRWDR